MSVVIEFIKLIKETKIVLTPLNFNTILNKIINKKDFKEIENTLLFDTKLFNGFKDDFFYLSNQDKLRFSSFVFLYFMNKSINKNFNTELLNEYIIIYDSFEIEEILRNIETDRNKIQDIEELIRKKEMNFEDQQKLHISLTEREKAVFDYKFKKNFLNLEIQDILKSEILILKFLKYLKLISEEEIKQIQEVSKFTEYKKYNERNFENKIINEKKFFTQTIKPIYSLDEYADMIMNTKEYLDDEKNKQKIEREKIKSIKMENYLISKKDNESKEIIKDVKLEDMKTFNLNDLGSLKDEDEELSDEEQRILNERKEYYSNGNTHNKG